MKAHIAIALVGALITVYLTQYHVAANYSDDKWDSLFMDYVSDYRKSYASADQFTARKNIFKANYIKIDTHNMQEGKTYEMGVN